MPELEQLRHGLQEVARHGADAARALPPTEVRRRGRRRRQVRMTGAALGLAALVGAGVAVAGLRGDQVTTAPPAGPLLDGSALPASMPFDRDPDRGVTWEAATTSTHEGGEPVSVCQQGSLRSLGAESVLVGTYRWVVELEPGEVLGPSTSDPELVVAIGQFAGAAEGRRAYAQLGTWLQECDAGGEPVRRYSTVAAELDAGTAQGWTALLTYEERPPVDPDSLIFDGQAVGLSADGTRVVLVSERTLGQDYNWLPEEAPITLRLQAVLETAS